MTNDHHEAGPAARSQPDPKYTTELHNRRVREVHAAQKTALFDALAGSGVTHLVVKFDGYGDEGQIEGIEARRGDHEVEVPQVELTVPRVVWGQLEFGQEGMGLSQLAEHLAYDLLTLGHDGWQDSDGSFGDFTFDVAARTISLDFNARYTSSENSTYEY